MKLSFLHWNWIRFFLCWGLIFCCGLGYAENLLRVGTYSFDETHKWVVLGIHSKEKSAIDLSSQFVGRELDRVHPKFLIEVNHEAIDRVWSFEQGEVFLTKPLVDIENAKRSQRAHARHLFLNSALKTLGFPFSTLDVIADRGSVRLEKERTFQASYLMQLVQLSLPPYDLFPDLLTAISLSPQTAQLELKRLGGALLTRYNPEGKRAGLKVPQDDEGVFFDKWRMNQVGVRSTSKEYMIRAANEQDLRIALVGDFFGIVFLQANDRITASSIRERLKYLKFEGLGLDERDSEIIAQAVRTAGKNGTLVPWYLVAFSNENGPLDLANFIAPRTFVRKLRNLTDRQFAADLGGSLLPFGSWVTHWARRASAKTNQSQGKTNYLRRTPSYGSILAITETRALEFSFPGKPLKDGPVEPPFFNEDVAFTHINAVLDRIGGSSSEEDLAQLVQTHTSAALHEASAELLRVERIGANLHTGFTREKTKFRETLKEAKQTVQNQTKKNATKILEFLNQLQTSSPKANHNPGRANRTLASVDSSSSLEEEFEESGVNLNIQGQERKPVIIFEVDGLRPDRFMEVAAQGLIPNLASLFFQKGVDLQSVASRSLTLPSWATIHTGFEPDYHGLKSNTPGSRTEKKITENFTDARKDLLHVKNWVKNRAFQRIEETHTGEPGKIWLPSYYPRNQVLLNHMPIVNRPTRAFGKLIEDYFTHIPEYANKIRFRASALDAASGRATAQRIDSDARHKKQLRLVINWYAGVDEASHYNNSILPTVYQEVDEAVGRVLEAARRHPVLKDATVFLLSDHGHTGGYGPFTVGTSLDLKEEEITWANDRPPLLANTGLSLTKFLTGQNIAFPNYEFVVGAALPPEPKYDLSLHSFIFSPYAFNYPFQFKRPTALVDCSGDNVAQIFIKSSKHWDRTPLQSLAEMETSSKAKSPGKIHLLNDLLNVTLPNLVVTHPVLIRKINELTQNHPVALLATALEGEEARQSADLLGARPDTFSSTREPVLVMSRSQWADPVSEKSSQGVAKLVGMKTGLILTRSNPRGEDEFRYIVLKNFRQSPAGTVSAEVSDNPEDDPLEYLGTVEGSHQTYLWRSDRQWLSASKHHKWPTAVFSIARLLTLAPKFTDPQNTLLSERIKKAHRAEIPDLVAIANPGYSFQSDEPLESDHGGLAREEVHNTFMISSLQAGEFAKHIRIEDYPIFTRDVMPTALAYAGLGENLGDPLPETQGMNLRPWLDSLLKNVLSPSHQ